MKAQLENEKKKIVGVQETKAEIDKVNLEIEEAKRSYDFTRAAELQYGKLPELQNVWKKPKARRANTRIQACSVTKLRRMKSQKSSQNGRVSP